MFKNVAGQSVTLFAFDLTTNAPKVGDQANMTGYVSVDDGPYMALASPVPTQDDAVKAKGYYTFTLTQAETNGNKLKFSAVSSTANVEVAPETFYTTPSAPVTIQESDTVITAS